MNFGPMKLFFFQVFRFEDVLVMDLRRSSDIDHIVSIIHDTFIILTFFLNGSLTHRYGISVFTFLLCGAILTLVYEFALVADGRVYNLPYTLSDI